MDSFPPPRRRTTRKLVGALAVAVALGVPAFASAARNIDGQSEATAAASCWEIKQLDASAPSGVYWLRTPKLQAPQQFYCDMTTDGGGWVLVGRGRQGWRSEYEGLGTAAQVRDNVTGTAAFLPRQLPGTVIDGLLDGRRVDSLTDGIRLRRATNTAGTTWQETRFTMRGRDRWSWAFRARHWVDNIKFDSTTSSNGQRSNNFGSDNNYRRVYTDITSAQGWNGGFGFGSSARGTTAADSYIWSASASIGYPIPFTQVYIRPKLMTADLTYPTVPAEGTAKIEQRAVHNSWALPTVWGVNGLAKGSGELRSEAQAFAQVGDYVYVGGNFRYVQKDEGGTGRVEQSYLAAFDVNTGEWVSTFRPTFNDQIKSLVALPDGTLAVGGEFTQANGQAAVGFTVLDPATGQTSPTLSAEIENRIGGGSAVTVRSMKVQGNWLYLGGAFTHTKASGDNYFRYARNAMRINLTTKRVDDTWNPNLGGTVNDITPSADGTRVYVAGYFETAGTSTFIKAGALTATSPATPLPWTPTFSVTNNAQRFQFTITETAHSVWLGGSEHLFTSYDKNSLALTSGSVAMAGGDFQTSVSDNATGVVYAGCHCEDYIYSGTTSYPWPSNFSQGEKLGFVGAWDEATGELIPDFAPKIKARQGYGAWSSFIDSNGNLWIGGDFESSVVKSGVSQWSGGFIRFSPRDTTAPPSPTDLQVNGDPSTVTLSWTPVSESGVTYEVLENGRVVATTSGNSVTLPALGSAAQYVVRAADASGNRSASTSRVTYDPASAPVTTTVVARNASWQWRYNSDAITGWQAPAFDSSSWSTGLAPLGWGSSDIGTDISAGLPGAKPLAAQFRTSFTVADPSTLDDVIVTYIADDGAVVYLNGQEISRQNLPTGTITQNTYATAAPKRATAEGNLVTVTVPASMLVAGQNVISAETHLNYKSTPDATFYLTAQTRG